MSKKLNSAVRAQITNKFVSAASTNSGRIHVVSSEGSWAVKKEGVKRATSVQPTIAKAISAAKSIAKETVVIVHKKDGTIKQLTAIQG